MSAQPIPNGNTLLTQAALGAQAPIYILAVPSGGDRSLIGKQLTAAGQITVAGVYRCIISLAGMVSAMQIHLKATFATGTVSSDIDSLYYTANPADPSLWSKKTASTGDGAMTTTVLQTATMTPAGEQWASVDITLGGTTACTFTVAEFNGK